MAKKETTKQTITISPPNFKVAKFKISGTAPFMQNRFSAKAQKIMEDKMKEGEKAKKGKKREPRDFEADCEAAKYISTEGWNGIPASAFRNACIEACRVAGFQMTRAKMSVFCVAEGEDATDGTPLVRISGPKPEMVKMAVRNETGVADIRARPQWRKWGVNLSLRYDADQFTAEDVANLLMRAGIQVGVGEGRPFSKKSNGLNLGTFEIAA